MKFSERQFWLAVLADCEGETFRTVNFEKVAERLHMPWKRALCYVRKRGAWLEHGVSERYGWFPTDEAVEACRASLKYDEHTPVSGTDVMA